ncbi:hypothetical protein EAS64_12085 [Trebonia kvetii]|uniref:Uncharacterized protein n=1 Tax=Trebonia kvetii TaxID=2480626 RepID=A0A6P2C299_9ACTN|nr:hypothetical protein [Trebonia kvetii]TVZ05308.1 hypothetical protein EAS64_12085 [Trebonia kvetii]
MTSGHDAACRCGTGLGGESSTERTAGPAARADKEAHHAGLGSVYLFAFGRRPKVGQVAQPEGHETITPTATA